MFNRARFNRARFDRGPAAGAATAAELEPTVVAALKGSADLAALCGDRIYPSHIPQQSTLPALSYEITREDRVVNLRGAAGLRRVTFDFEARSPKKADNLDIREVVRNLFQGFIGTLGRMRIKYISLDTENDQYEQPTPGLDDGTYAKMFAFTFVVRETVPAYRPPDGAIPTGATELEPAIVAALKGSADLGALCGESIYPSHIPQQSTLPALSYEITQAERVMSLRGAAGLRRVAVEFECRSPKKSDNRDMREVVRNLFQGFIGTLDQVKVKYISLDNEFDEYEQPTPGLDDGTYVKSFTFTFVVRESVPSFA